MKKLVLFMCVLAFVTSCTPEILNDDATTSDTFTEPEKVCPPSDRNCNGIPDSQE